MLFAQICYRASERERDIASEIERERDREKERVR